MMNVSRKEHEVLGCLSKMPKNMVMVYESENIPEFVLYDLCHENCFDVPKAAYFVDNPDFNICKGVAGYCRSDHYGKVEDIWGDPEEFTVIMKSCPFNQQVRSLELNDIHVNGNDYEQIIQAIAQHCEFKEPRVISWKMKHDNIGVLVYECAGIEPLNGLEKHLHHGVHFFSFCPVF